MHELEITPSQIARLVLGYLKAERCDGAHEEFLKSSKHLKELRGRIITRVDHKTLGDFLSEYSQLNILIQERIEESDFYSEHNSATTLVDQLSYLLNCGRINASTHNSSVDVGVNTDVRATSLTDLPGNTVTQPETKDGGLLLDDAALPQTDDVEGAVKNNGNTAAQDVEAAIKNIVQKATSDPFFDKVVKEVIGDDDVVVEGGNKSDLDGNTGATAMGTIDMTRPCYVLSDQDIMSMPIVVCDDKRDKQGLGPFIIPTNVNQQVAPTYLVNLTANNDLPSTSIQFYQNDQQKKLKPIREKRRRIVPTTISRPDPVKILPEPPKPTETTITIQLQEPVVAADEEPKPKPPPLCTPLNDGGGGGTTPRSSGSHVRALDFSTPQKLLEVEPIKKDAKPSWDSDLRGLIQSSPEREKKKKEAAMKGGKKKKKQKLNKTAEEGKLIEKALCEEKVIKKEKEEEGSKLVLSPSKLSSSCKRNIVDLTESDEKKTPPEKIIDLTGVKKKLIESMQTPMKMDMTCPKTPGFFSPITNTDTPLTKVLKEQLHGIDITSIPTPKFPVTPSFAITPSMDANYANRPTDYSSSSSYYQPSDNENNRSIEQLIEECNRLEREIPADKQIKILDDVIITPGTDLKAVAEKMKTLSKNVIGRKNLRLVEPAEDLDSSCSTCSSATTTSSDATASEDEESNQTVIAKQTTQRYSLRLRKNLSTVTETPNTTTTEAITSILSNVQVKSTLEVGKTHEEILAEMEEKRKKMIEKLEKDQKEADEKKRKVVPKKKVPAKKTPVRRGRKTKTESPEDEFLKNPQSSSTPSVGGEKKKRAANQETEKVVGDLNSILDTNDVKVEEKKGATKRKAEKTRRRSSAKTSDESATKSKLDVSLDEETEKLLENLCISKEENANKAKKLKLDVDAEKSERKTVEVRKVSVEKELGVGKGEKRKENSVKKTDKRDKVIAGKDEVQEEVNTVKKPENEQVFVGEKEANSVEKTDEKDEIETKKNFVEKTDKTDGGRTQVSVEKIEKKEESEKLENKKESSVEVDKNKKVPIKKTEKKDETKKVESRKKSSESEKNKKRQKTPVVKSDKSKNVENKQQTVDLHKNKGEQKVSAVTTKEEHKTEKVESVELNNIEKEPKIPVKEAEKLENKQKSIELDKHKKQVSFEKTAEETKVNSKKDFVASNKTEKAPKVSTEKSQSKHEVVEEKQKVAKEKIVETNTEKANEKEPQINSESKRSHVEKVYEKLFGDSAEEEPETEKENATDLTQNAQPIAQQYKQLVDDLAVTPDTSFTKQQQDDAIKAKELEQLLLESEETEVTPDKLVSDLKERGIHLVHNKTSPPPPRKEVEQQQQQNDLELLESEFSVCLFHRENVHYKHDPYIRPNKKMSDYDFTLLTKEMNATVYLAEFDAEVQKVMTCTPFETLLEIPSKIDVMPKKKPAPKPQKPNPLELLNKQLDTQNQKIATNSPLENLYDDGKAGKTNAVERVVVRKKAPSKKSDHKRARSLSNSQEKKPEEPTRKSSRIKNRRSSEPKPTGAEEILAAQEGANKTEEVCRDEAEDELMNYAAVGTPEKCLKKRKADEKPEGHHLEKKLKPEKCKELLKDIDVDEFLSHLHGDT